jgi:peptidoglycan/xylan/chitin deacetylase (PgdA/CDA1 family)
MLRLDKAFTQYAVAPLYRLLGGPGEGLPILMYHSISDEPEDHIAPYYRVNASVSVFETHMRYLSREGYRTLALADLVSALEKKMPLPAKHVVLTFDDGFHNCLTAAFPILQKYGFSATVFLPTAYIGRHTRRTFKNRDCLTWSEVRDLRSAGIHFGSHTVTHPELLNLPWKQVQDELKDSKGDIEQNLQEPINDFAYPFAFPQAARQFVPRFRSALIDAGYKSCATTQIGRIVSHQDPYRLARIPANSEDDHLFLKCKLEGAYDWLALPQSILKRCKPQRSPSLSAMGRCVSTSAFNL